MEKKKWYLSKAVWAGIVTFAIGVYSLATPFVAQFGVTLPSIPDGVLIFLGGLGVYGRATASTAITK